MKLAIVVQRFGEDLSGGAEKHAAALAKALNRTHEVHLLTTCARDYQSWLNHYPEGESREQGMVVHRFSVDFPRNKSAFDALTLKLLRKSPRFIEQLEWLVHQGPYSESLFRYIENNREHFDFFIFYTYLYCTTFLGIIPVADKSILIPTAHDEPVAHFTMYRALYNLPRALLFLTPEERSMVHRLYGNSYKPERIIGFGIDTPSESDGAAFRNKYGIQTPYLYYVGRIDAGKDCDELVTHFTNYCESHPDIDITLVMVGQGAVEGDEHPAIKKTGFIDEKDKWDGYAGALLSVAPSPYESLSIHLLESLSVGCPVLASHKSPVVKGHIERSGAGWLYGNQSQFDDAITQALNDISLREQLAARGRAYIDANYRWEHVLSEIEALLQQLSGTGTSE